MAIPKGTAAYKKKDGILTVTSDQKSVVWYPQAAPDGSPSVTLSISNITNLQQTPDTAPKVMLKIFEKPPDAPEPVTYLFHFNSPGDPRAEANAVRDMLSKLLADAKNNDPSVPRPANGGGSGSGAMAFASAAVPKQTADRFFDDNQLKNDIILQQSLMKADRNLQQMYMEGRMTKPDLMSDATFNAQFWSTRINLLRAHAIETSQTKAPFNVLSQVKPVKEASAPDKEPEWKLTISVEQVQMIFQQHPLIKRIYNENVPNRIEEKKFWQRFFFSALSKQLRGARPDGTEEKDDVFDKYKADEDITAFAARNLAEHVPHMIDLEGNEENQGGFKGGNRKDREMQPTRIGLIPTFNSLSEKMLSRVKPLDRDPEVDPRADEEALQQLELRDLLGDNEEHRLILNIKEQARFFANQNAEASIATDVFSNQDPTEVLNQVQTEIGTIKGGAGGVDLQSMLGIDDESESDDESTIKKPAHVGSRTMRKDAQKQVLKGMRQRRAQLYGHSSDESSPMGLSPDMTSKCNLTHATTMEFLHQFWSAFLSGDPDRAMELGYLVESLKKSKERIRAVADEAEKVRAAEIQRRRDEIVEIYNRTKKKKTFKESSIRGGRDGVMRLMAPVVHTLDRAIANYEKALNAEGLQPSTET